MTKTPDIYHHSVDCPYRLGEENKQLMNLLDRFVVNRLSWCLQFCYGFQHEGCLQTNEPCEMKEMLLEYHKLKGMD
jgi:hypothetical protein